MMQSRILAVAVLVSVSLACAGCHVGEVRLYKSRAQREQVWMQKLDPDIFKTHEKSIGLNVKVAALGGLASISPGIQFVNRAKAEWDGNVQALFAKYTLLINDHNTAHITLEEYWEKRNELDSLFVQMAMNRPVVENSINTFYEYWKVQSDQAFKDLDAELKKKAEKAAEVQQEEVKGQIEEINKKIKAISEKMQASP